METETDLAPQRLVVKFTKPAFMGVSMHTIECPGPTDYPTVDQLLPGGFSEKELGCKLGMAIIEVNGQSMQGEAGKTCKEVLKSILPGKSVQMVVQRGSARPLQEQACVPIVSGHGVECDPGTEEYNKGYDRALSDVLTLLATTGVAQTRAGVIETAFREIAETTKTFKYAVAAEATAYQL